MSTFFVLLLGAIVIGAAILTVTRRNPIHAALWMLVSLGGIAGLFLGLRSPFLAAMQILLYTGAIMVLFVFVIMLLTLKEDEMGEEPPHSKKLLAGVGATLLVFSLFYALAARDNPQLQAPYHEQVLADARAAGQTVPADRVVDFGSTEHFARFLYTDYVVPFELITVLVMAAVAGVIVLARRPDRLTLEETRVAGGPS